MVNRRFLTGVAAVLLAVSVTGCGSNTVSMMDNGEGSAYSAKNMAMAGAGEPVIAESEEAYETSYDSYDQGSDSDLYDTVKDTAMMIRDADISVDVKDLYSFNNNVMITVDDYGGYFESSTLNDYESPYSTDRYGYYTIRIPQDKLDEFINHVNGEGTVTSRNITTEDVSLEYVDLDAHIKALESERDELNDLMDKAESVEDVISIKEQLTSVQYELDSLTGRMDYLKGRVKYSTVRLTAHEERNVEHPIRMALEINFRERVVDGLSNAVEAFVTIITGIPLIAIVTAFVIAFIWLLRKILRKIFKRKGHMRYTIVPVFEKEEEEDATGGFKFCRKESKDEDGQRTDSI